MVWSSLLLRMGIFFSAEQLKNAQKYYREGYLSTIDVQENQAIITKKINREETYSVIEWNGKTGPEIRTSIEEEEVGIALATAGLYEIEELITELQEKDPLLGDRNLESIQDDEFSAPETEEDEPVSVSEDITCTKLLIRIEISSQKGLRAIPEWKSGAPKRVPVYSAEALDLKNCDRPALMRFVTEAGRLGFVFQKESGDFLLDDWTKVAKLADESLRLWEHSFEIEYGGDAHLLKHGQRTLSWEIEARSRDDENMTLRENFHIGNRRLGTRHIRRLPRQSMVLLLYVVMVW